MPGTIEIVTTRPYRNLTVSAYPDGNDTAAVSAAAATEETNRKGVYRFSNPVATGLHMLILSDDIIPVWQAWAVLATDGVIVASETREAALLRQSINSSGQVQASTLADRTGFSLTTAYDAAKTAAQAGTAMSLVDGALTQAKTGADLRVKLDATQGDYAPAKAGDSMTLTSGERAAIAAAVEAAIIDEADTNAVLEAITDKIAEANPDLGDLTVSAIASAARDAVLNALLSNHDGAGTIGKAIAQVLAKTINLPGDPASETGAASHRNSILSAVGAVPSAVKAELESESSKLTQIHDKLPTSEYLAGSTQEDGSVELNVENLVIENVAVDSLSQTALQQLAGVRQIHISVPVLSGQQLSQPLVQGNSYSHDLESAIEFSRSDFPDIPADASITLYARNVDVSEAAFTIAGSVPVATGAKVVRFEATSAESIHWVPGKYEFRADVTFPGGEVRSFVGPNVYLRVLPAAS